MWPQQNLFTGTFGTEEVASRTVECTRGEGGVAGGASVAMEEGPWPQHRQLPPLRVQTGAMCTMEEVRRLGLSAQMEHPSNLYHRWGLGGEPR